MIIERSQKPTSLEIIYINLSEENHSAVMTAESMNKSTKRRKLAEEAGTELARRYKIFYPSGIPPLSKVNKAKEASTILMMTHA